MDPGPGGPGGGRGPADGVREGVRERPGVAVGGGMGEVGAVVRPSGEVGGGQVEPLPGDPPRDGRDPAGHGLQALPGPPAPAAGGGPGLADEAPADEVGGERGEGAVGEPGRGGGLAARGGAVVGEVPQHAGEVVPPHVGGGLGGLGGGAHPWILPESRGGGRPVRRRTRGGVERPGPPCDDSCQ
ncbi:hypothetical protein [Streptomyces filamentosus]|uniref:hypothetical protein n=1 Tax=Streptomyces filamentosus TaxID=67294 RepID=UPI001F3E1C5A|nr:hypothetical protein [Streptomyces filamentosus]